MTSLREIELRLGEEAVEGARQKEEGKNKKFATANPSVGGEEGGDERVISDPPSSTWLRRDRSVIRHGESAPHAAGSVRA